MVGQLKWIEFEVFGIGKTCMMVYTALVGKKVIVNFEGNFKWSVFNKLNSHQSFIASAIESAYIVIVCCIGTSTCLVCMTLSISTYRNEITIR